MAALFTVTFPKWVYSKLTVQYRVQENNPLTRPPFKSLLTDSGIRLVSDTCLYAGEVVLWIQKHYIQVMLRTRSDTVPDPPT